MAYADYEFYTNMYLGNAIGPEDFPRLAERASTYIDAATWNRSKNAAGEALEAIRQACCALAEVFQDEGRVNQRAYSPERPIQSETVGSWSRSYGSQTATEAESSVLAARKREILRLYLGPTGLLKMRGYR